MALGAGDGVGCRANPQPALVSVIAVEVAGAADAAEAPGAARATQAGTRNPREGVCQAACQRVAHHDLHKIGPP